MAESVALTPEEQRQFRPLFAQYDTDGTNIVLGDRVRPLLERSGLPPITLSQIWQMVDTENRGFLDFTEFSRCMRLVYHVQHGQQLSPRLANIPSGLPDLTRAAGAATSPPKAPSPRLASPPTHAAGPLTALSTGGSTYSANGETRIPAMTTQDKKRFGALFDRSVPAPNGYMDGNVAKEIFLKARLAPDTLGQVWALVDVDGRGKLTKNEFVVAMHLIQSLIGKTMTSLPSALPSTWAPWLGQHGTAGAATAAPATAAQSVVKSPAVPGHTGPGHEVAARSFSGQGSHPPVPAPTVPTAKVASLSIAPLERSQYDAIFDSLDQSKSGILGPAEAVPVLTKSGLSDEVLARVWDLSDRQKRGQLDKSDFAIAMHLLKAKMNGQELPSDIPPPSSPPAPPAPVAAAPRAMSPSGTSSQDPHGVAPPQRRATTGTLAQQHSGSFPKPPQRSFTQQSTSSMDDLVSLDHAIFRPLEPAKPTRAEPIPEDANEPTSDVKFVPTTTFGQQLLQSRTRGASASPATPAAGVAANHGDAQHATKVATEEAKAPGVAPQPALAAASPPAPDLQQQARELHDLESRVAAQHRERMAAHEELAAVLKEKSELETKIRDLRTTYDNGAKDVHQTKQAVTEAREAIKKLEKDIALRSSGMEAIRAQQDEQNTQRSAAEARITELQGQLTQIQSHIDNHNSDSQRFTEEQAQHKSTIAEHEAKLEQLKSEADRSAWRRQELEAETLRHKERAVQAQAAAHAQAQRAEAVKAAADAAEARAKAESDAADAHARSAAAEPPAAAAALAPAAAVAVAADASREPNKAAVPSSGTSSTLTEPGSVPQRVNSLHSASESVPDSVNATETPRTSPPTSEANYPGLEQVTMPSFTLPMQQPHSATSSVVNNPPQSVRGDFGSEPSEPQSPDLSTPVSGINPPESMELRHGQNEDNDSFEFVDAREGEAGSGIDQGAVDSSDDDEPADAIPRKYGEPSPRQPAPERQTPAELRPQASSPVPSGNVGLRKTDSASPTPFAPAQPQTQMPEPTLPHSTPAVPAAPAQESAATAGASAPVSAPAPEPAQARSAPVPADDFEGFDDLEEARDDDTEDFGATFSSTQVNTSSAGPDEWQQLFSGSQPSSEAAAQPVQQPQVPSGPISELTSMGFTEEEARIALEIHGNNLSEATNYLLDRM